MFFAYLILSIFVCAFGKDVKIDITSLGKSAVGVPSEETGKRVEKWKPTDEVNPEELGEYSQGDILFVAGKTRNGLAPESTRWPNAIIPFEIDGDFGKTLIVTKNSGPLPMVRRLRGGEDALAESGGVGGALRDNRRLYRL